MSITWNNPSVKIEYDTTNVSLEINLTPNELVSAIYNNFNSQVIVEVIGEILANYDIEVTQKVEKMIKEWSE